MTPVTHRIPSDREMMASRRSRRRQRRRWLRAWIREGMPGYWEAYESRRFGDWLLDRTRSWR